MFTSVNFRGIFGKAKVHINKNRESGHFNDPIGSPQM